MSIAADIIRKRSQSKSYIICVS